LNKSAALALALVLLAGCGGGGGGGNSALPGGSQAKSQSKVTGSVVISIPVASTTTQSLARPVRYPQFVSPNATSVEMNVNGGSDTNFDVSSTSSLCVTVSNVRNCTLSFGAPVGSETFGFLVFSSPNGTGTQLASSTSLQTIVAGQDFGFTVALNAAVGVITTNFMLVTNNNNGSCPDGPISFNGINEGCSGSAPFSVTVDDPSGAQITGTALYATPIQVTVNDPALSATPSSFTAPGQTVTLAYTGAPFANTFGNTAVVTLTAGGQSAQLNIPVLRQYLYVANSNAPFGSAPAGGGT
jgi:hypothetical protein